MTTHLRLMAGAAALAVGLWALTSATAAPTLPKDAYKKAVEADVAALQKLLNGGKPDKRAGGTIKATALMIALYGEGMGDAALTAQAIKVAEAAAKKDWAAADTEAKALSSPKGGSAKGPVHAQAKLDLDDVMAPFRLSKVGGLNIEKDIRDATKAGAKVDAKAAELLGARTAALAHLTAQFPNDKAKTNAGNKAKWEKYSKDMLEAGQQIATEAAKGGDKLGPVFKRLDASCTNCHNDFRD